MCPREFFPHHVVPLTCASHPGCVPNPWAISPCPSRAPPQQYIIITPLGLCLGLNQSSPPPGLCNLAHIAEMMPHRAACNLPKADLAILSLRVGVIVHLSHKEVPGVWKWHATGLIYRLIRPVDSPYEMNEACCTRYISISNFINFILLLQENVKSSRNHGVLLYKKKADGQKWHITSVIFKTVKHRSFSEKSSDACYAFFETYSFFKTSTFSLHWGKSFLKPISAEALLKT